MPLSTQTSMCLGLPKNIKNPPAPSPDGCSGRLKSFSARICLTDSLSREFCNPYGRSKSKSILANSGPSWQILVHPGKFWSILEVLILGPFRGPFRDPFRDNFGVHFGGPQGPVEAQRGPRGAQEGFKEHRSSEKGDMPKQSQIQWFLSILRVSGGSFGRPRGQKRAQRSLQQGIADGVQQGIQNWTQNDTKMGPKMDPKMGPKKGP